MLTGSPVSLCSGLGLTQRERGCLLHLEAGTLSYWVGHNFLKRPISYLAGDTGISGPTQIKKPSIFLWGFPGGSVVKNLPANAIDTGSTPGLGRYPGEGNNPLQYSCLGNSMVRGAWWGYSPWGCKESDMAEHTCTYPHTLWVLVQDVQLEKRFFFQAEESFACGQKAIFALPS